MPRFIIRYKEGKATREKVIEARNFDAAEEIADSLFPPGPTAQVDLRFENAGDAQAIYQVV